MLKGSKMAKTVSTIRFTPEEKEQISAFAALSGKSFSAQVREWTLERLDDELDARELSLAVEQARKDNDEGNLWSEVKDIYKNI